MGKRFFKFSFIENLPIRIKQLSLISLLLSFQGAFLLKDIFSNCSCILQNTLCLHDTIFSVLNNLNLYKNKDFDFNRAE